MRQLAFVIFSLFAVNAFASTAKVNPEHPIVITADFRSASGEWISAPSIRAEFSVQASEDITLTGVKFTATAKGGSAQEFTWQLPMGGVEVAKGASYVLPLGYVYSLGPVGVTQFDVHMEYQGWTGKANAPTGRLNLAADFVTQ